MKIMLSPTKTVTFDFMFTESRSGLDTASTIHLMNDKDGGRYVAVDTRVKETQRILWRQQGHACHTVSYNPLHSKLATIFLDKLELAR
jgi:hypothetical protein